MQFLFKELPDRLILLLKRKPLRPRALDPGSQGTRSTFGLKWGATACPSLAQRQPPGCVCDRGGLVLPRGASDSLPAGRGCAQASQCCAVLGAPISPTGGLPCGPSHRPVLGGTQCQSALQSGESRALPSHPKALWPAPETHPPSQVRAGLSSLTSPVGRAPVPSPCPGPVRRLLPSPGHLSRQDPLTPAPPHRHASWCAPSRLGVMPCRERCLRRPLRSQGAGGCPLGRSSTQAGTLRPPGADERGGRRP